MEAPHLLVMIFLAFNPSEPQIELRQLLPSWQRCEDKKNEYAADAQGRARVIGRCAVWTGKPPK